MATRAITECDIYHTAGADHDIRPVTLHVDVPTSDGGEPDPAETIVITLDLSMRARNRLRKRLERALRPIKRNPGNEPEPGGALDDDSDDES